MVGRLGWRVVLDEGEGVCEQDVATSASVGMLLCFPGVRRRNLKSIEQRDMCLFIQTVNTV